MTTTSIKWIKASEERTPKDFKIIANTQWRTSYDKKPFFPSLSGTNSVNETGMFGMTSTGAWPSFTWEELEWLEEKEVLVTTDAETFATWVYNECDALDYIDSHGKFKYHVTGGIHTMPELYQIFLSPDRALCSTEIRDNLQSIPSKEVEETDWILAEKAYAMGFLNRTDMMSEVDGLKDRWELAKSFLKHVNKKNKYESNRH